MAATGTYQITPRGPYSLHASIRFLEGFAPAHYRGTARPGEARMRLAFPVEGSWQTAAVTVGQAESGIVTVDVEGATPDGLHEQLARMLSLDLDATGLAEVRRRDPVVDCLADTHPGLRPVCFHSPYEAACWAVIGHRIRIVQAAAIKERIAQTYGEHRTVGGVDLAAFPDPETLRTVLDELPLPDVKRDRLGGIATAALDGILDGARLRALDAAAALDLLKQLDGIGPFSAELIVVRGAGAPDVFPASERRLHDSMRQLYQCPDADLARLAEIAAGWSPYRSWVSLLIRTHREDTTGEIGGAGR